MARYIELDKAIQTAIEVCVKLVGHGITQIDAVNIAYAFEDIPTADVAREIFEGIYRKLEYYERYRELNDIINNFFVFIEEAEKEYTEVEDLEQHK